jgi:hypothetical protein
MDNLWRLLEKGTMAGVIKWTPNGTEARTEVFGLVRGYKTKLNEYSVETIVKQTSRLIMLTTEEYWESAISIEKGEEKIVFTSNPEEIKGKKDGAMHVVCAEIHHMAEDKNIVTSLSKEISALLFLYS